MPLMSRRSALMVGTGFLAAPRPMLAATPVEIVTTAFPPMTIDDPVRPGFVNAVLIEMLRLIGREGRITHLPWAETQRRGREEAGLLITPPVRTAQREPHYTWVVKVLDIHSVFASRGRPLDLASGRAAERIGILRGSMHAAHLQQVGYTNLVESGSLEEMMTALVSGTINGAFSNEGDLQSFALQRNRMPDAVFGPPVLTSAAYIASGSNTGDLPLADLAAAFGALEQDGTVERLHGTYQLGLTARG